MNFSLTDNQIPILPVWLYYKELGASTHLKRDIGQVQICLGTDGLSQKDERLYVLYILNNILGGGLSSHLDNL